MPDDDVAFAQLSRSAKGARISGDRNMRQNVRASGGTSSDVARAILVLSGPEQGRQQHQEIGDETRVARCCGGGMFMVFGRRGAAGAMLGGGEPDADHHAKCADSVIPVGLFAQDNDREDAREDREQVAEIPGLGRAGPIGALVPAAGADKARQDGDIEHEQDAGLCDGHRRERRCFP